MEGKEDYSTGLSPPTISSESLCGGSIFSLCMCASARTGKAMFSSSSGKSLRLHLSTRAFSVRAFRFSALRVRDKIKLFSGVDTVASSFLQGTLKDKWTIKLQQVVPTKLDNYTSGLPAD